MAGLAIFLLWRAFFLPRALAYVLALGCVGAAGYSFTFALSSGTKEGPLLILALFLMHFFTQLVVFTAGCLQFEARIPRGATSKDS